MFSYVYSTDGKGLVLLRTTKIDSPLRFAVVVIKLLGIAVSETDVYSLVFFLNTT